MGIGGQVVGKAVFLDRDGVINRAIVREGKPCPPANLAELEILPGVAQALEKLRAAGFLLVVVTNQPDVARGTTRREVVEEINTSLAAELPIDEFRTCYHDSGDGCECRKPKPGALLIAAKQYGLDIAQSYMVGDRWRDIEAGQKAGCKTIFVDYCYDEKQPNTFDYKVASLAEATVIILNKLGEVLCKKSKP
jgi:D-glycero-D-manno-heptose 1,7-bisphosphate phosphatase